MAGMVVLLWMEVLLMEEMAAMEMQATDFVALMEEMAVWFYSGVLLMESLVLILVTSEMAVLQWDKVVKPMVKMDMKVG
jgi:hypothetical protein